MSYIVPDARITPLDSAPGSADIDGAARTAELQTDSRQEGDTMTLNTPQLPPPDVARIRHRDSRDGFPPFVVEVSDVDDGTWTPISFHEDHASALAALVRVGGELATEDGPTFPHTYPAGDDYRVRAHYPNGHAATYRADVPSDAAAMVRALVATGVAAQVYGPSGLPYTPARDAAAGMLADIATRDDG